MLFILCINDDIRATNNVKFVIYTDETNTLFLTDKSLNNLVPRSNDALIANEK